MGELHCLDVGCADCSVIVTPKHTFLIDCSGVDQYADLLPPNKRLRGVFITHQHYDHFDGLKYLKQHGYTIDFLVYSPYERRTGDDSVRLEEWNEFITYREHFVAKGTEVRAPFRQDCLQKPWWDAGDARFWVLGPVRELATSATRELHDASLVIHTVLGNRKCLFAGDASDQSLNRIQANTQNICGDILHASHHGSINGADLDFVKACKAQYTVVSTKSGVHDSVPCDTALARYKSHTSGAVYRTDVDGSRTFTT